MKKKISAVISKKVHRPKKLQVSDDHKTRLVISCTDEEKMAVKMLAAKNNMTMSEYLLLPIQNLANRAKVCDKGHVPNDETAKVLKELDSGKGWNKRKNLDDFWRSLGLDK